MDVKVKIRNISMIIAVVFSAFSGLFFILYADLYFSADSFQLFAGIVLALASIVFMILSESFKHKPVVFYIFKILGVLLLAGFVVYVFYFKTLPIFEKKTFLKLIKDYQGQKVFFLDSVKFHDAMDIEFNKVPPYIVLIVTSIIGVVGQAVNTISNAFVGLD